MTDSSMLDAESLPQRLDTKTRRYRSMDVGEEPLSKERKLGCFFRQRFCADSCGEVFEMQSVQVNDRYMETSHNSPIHVLRQCPSSRDISSSEDPCDGFYFSSPCTPEDSFDRSTCDNEVLMQSTGSCQNSASWQQLSKTTLPVHSPQSTDLASSLHCIEAIYI
jgi:hypothetical protein